MKTIIKRGSPIYVDRCINCKSIFSFEDEDYDPSWLHTYKSNHPYATQNDIELVIKDAKESGLAETLKDEYYITCPACGETYFNIGFTLYDKALEQYKHIL